jgi:hypothetical protein
VSGKRHTASKSIVVVIEINGAREPLLDLSSELGRRVGYAAKQHRHWHIFRFSYACVY